MEKYDFWVFYFSIEIFKLYWVEFVEMDIIYISSKVIKSKCCQKISLNSSLKKVMSQKKNCKTFVAYILLIYVRVLATFDLVSCPTFSFQLLCCFCIRFLKDVLFITHVDLIKVKSNNVGVFLLYLVSLGLSQAFHSDKYRINMK